MTFDYPITTYEVPGGGPELALVGLADVTPPAAYCDVLFSGWACSRPAHDDGIHVAMTTRGPAAIGLDDGALAVFGFVRRSAPEDPR